jgi:hypothetical protein
VSESEVIAWASLPNGSMIAITRGMEMTALDQFGPIFRAAVNEAPIGVIVAHTTLRECRERGWDPTYPPVDAMLANNLRGFVARSLREKDKISEVDLQMAFAPLAPRRARRIPGEPRARR